MSEENNKPKKLSLSGSGKLSLGGGAVDPASLRGGMVGSGRGKTVQVEVRRKRVGGAAVRPAAVNTPAPVASPVENAPAPEQAADQAEDRLTAAERANRMKVLQEGLSKSKEAASTAVEQEEAQPAAGETLAEKEEVLDPREARRRAELAELEEIEKQAAAQRLTETERLAAENAARQAKMRQQMPDMQPAGPVPIREDAPIRNRRKTTEIDSPMRPAPVKRDGNRRRSGKMTISQALSEGDGRQRSLASVRRQREKARMRESQPQVKQVRDVVIPDTITVQELANRKAGAHHLAQGRARDQLEVRPGQFLRVLPHPHGAPAGAALYRPRLLDCAPRNVRERPRPHRPARPAEPARRPRRR